MCVFRNPGHTISSFLAPIPQKPNNTDWRRNVAYRVNNILHLLDICQSTILDKELSINNLISNEKRNTDYFTKTPYFK